jgi:hypothetical protein
MKYRIIKDTFQGKVIYVAQRWGLTPTIREGWVRISRNNSIEEAEKMIEKFHKQFMMLKQQQDIEVVKEFEL